MSATSSGALKVKVESLGLSISAYRDQAPKDATLPLVVIHEGISKSRERMGDLGDSNAPGVLTELVQVDVVQRMRDPATNAVVESATLPEAVIDGLHGANLATAPKLVYGCTVDGSVRLVESDTGLVTDAITVRLRRRF